MAQQATSSGPQRIDLEDPSEVASWSDQYGCTEEQLRSAVKAAGAVAQDVREYIAKQAKDAIKRAS
ncbi:DUF3606 domain-containing protein [Variovorax rhizosphaerae]|uniref:DUF3606 domain-containing protein n=1 Tax=Variovorax rhizosphaerae TaxID=1836200 RepID=A0ABU8WUR6_9BURK